jgi:hypothetical protein
MISCLLNICQIQIATTVEPNLQFSYVPGGIANPAQRGGGTEQP